MLGVGVAAVWLLGTACLGHDHNQVPGHNLARPYIMGGVDIPDWAYGGNTAVASDQVRLTSDRQSQRGYLWNTRGHQRKDWQVEFEYKVHGTGSRLFGDGFGFWYVSDRSFKEMKTQKDYMGTTFGGPDSFDGLLVYFDTYRNGNYNHQFPWIGAMHGNGERRYDHDNDGKEHELDGCVHRFRNSKEKERLKIVYTRGTLGVYTSTGERDKWEECLLVTDIWLPKNGHFGFTSQTGDVADNHDIVAFNSFRFNLLNVPERQRQAITEAAHGFRGDDNTKDVTPDADLERRVAENLADDNVKELKLNPEKLKKIFKSEHEHGFDKKHKPRRSEDKPTVMGIFYTFLKIVGVIIAVVILVVAAYFGYSHMQKKKAQRRFT